MNFVLFEIILLAAYLSSASSSKEKEDPAEKEWRKSWEKACKKKDFGCSVWCQANSVPGLPFFCGGVCQGFFANYCSCLFCPPGTEFMFPYPNIYPKTHGRPQSGTTTPHPDARVPIHNPVGTMAPPQETTDSASIFGFLG